MRTHFRINKVPTQLVVSRKGANHPPTCSQCLHELFVARVLCNTSEIEHAWTVMMDHYHDFFFRISEEDADETN